MTKHRNGSLEKSARLIVLMEMQDAGKLAGLSLQSIANLLPDRPNRATIMRDLRDLGNLRDVLAEMKEKMQ